MTRHYDEKEFLGDVTFSGGVTLPAAVSIGAGGVGTTEIADGAVTPTKQSFGVTVSTDANLAITANMEVIHMVTTGAGTRVITNSSMITGKIYWLNMTAQSTGTYTMANVDGATTLTFNAAGERAAIYYDGTALRTMFLNGATLV